MTENLGLLFPSDKNTCTCSGHFAMSLASLLIGLFSPPLSKRPRGSVSISQLTGVDSGGWGLAEWRIPFHLTRMILFPELQHLVTLTGKQASVDGQLSTEVIITTTTLSQ